MQNSQQFTDKNETHTRSCIFAPDKRGSQGDNITIAIVAHHASKQTGQCNYGYRSSLNQAGEGLSQIHSGSVKYVPKHERAPSND